MQQPQDRPVSIAASACGPRPAFALFALFASPASLASLAFLAVCAAGALLPLSALADARSPVAAPMTSPSPSAAPAPPQIYFDPTRPSKSGLSGLGGISRTDPSTVPPGVSAATSGQPGADQLRQGLPACATDPFKTPETAAAPDITASRELERLKSTALTAPVLIPPNQPNPPSAQRLANARPQRLQANAAWQMGLLTLHGICVVLNTADAQVWFELAQRLGEPLAPAGLAWCEMTGCKAAANPTAARQWIDQLYAADAPRALYLQWLLQAKLAPLELMPLQLMPLGTGTLNKRDTPLPGRPLLLAAARRGDTNAQIELGLDSVAAGDLPGAIAFFNAASARSAAAGLNVALVSQRLKKMATLPPPPPVPLPPPPVPSASVNVQSQSATDNLAQAQRYHRGVGVPANYTEAIRLYQLAQNQGNAAAKKMLGLIFSRPSPTGEIDVGWMQQLAQIDVAASLPAIDASPGRSNLKREPTPLFELVPKAWRRFVASSINA